MKSLVPPETEPCAQISAPPLSAPRGRPRTVRRVWLALAIALALVHPLAHALGRVSVVCDLVSQFQVVGLGATIAGLSIALALKSPVAWALAVTALVQSAPRCAPWLPTRPAGSTSAARPLRLLVANILFVNQNHTAIKQLIERERPDVVGLLEVSKHHLRAMPDLAAQFPVRAEFPRHDSQGLALWSRNPLDGPIELLQPTPDGAPLLRASIAVNGTIVRFYLAHTHMPFARIRRERGFAELAWLREELKRGDGPSIVAGDLNTTDSSPHFDDLLREGRLRDSRQGFGPQPSWPTWSPLRLTLDHILVSHGLSVVSRRLGREFGSDHLPIVVELVAEGSDRDSSSPSVESNSSHP
jgi:endonuclease/exonuclease/phosphatase (EEP) superfamily protein YafD